MPMGLEDFIFDLRQGCFHRLNLVKNIDDGGPVCSFEFDLPANKVLAANKRTLQTGYTETMRRYR